MIDREKIFNLITQAFHKSDQYFHWGDNAIVQGSLQDLPAPKAVVDNFDDGDYFAIVQVDDANPGDVGQHDLVDPNFNYDIQLYCKGKQGDITKIRNDLVKHFSAGWYNFWSQVPRYILKNQNVSYSISEVESELDVLGVRFTGTISIITTKGGSLYG